jgi:capsular polysaccharide biosynthesis protein
MAAYINATYVDSYQSYGSIFLVEEEEGFTADDVSYSNIIMQDYIYRITGEENMRAAAARLPDEIRAIYAESDASEEDVEAYIARVKNVVNWSYLSSITTITNIEDTHYLKVTVNSTDPMLAYATARAVLNASLNSLSDFFKVESVSIDAQPRLPETPASHKSYRNALLVSLIGALAVVGILVLLYIRNDKINTSEDVEKYLGLTVLAMIPESEPKDELSEGSAHKTRRRA